MNYQLSIPINNTENEASYRAQVQSFPSQIKRSDLDRHIQSLGKCFVGISLQNPNFIGNKMRSVVDWISKRFPECNFLLGDHVHRLTLQIRQELAEENSYNNALGLGDLYLRTHRKILTGENKNLYTEIIRGSEIYSTNEVAHFRSLLRECYDNNLEFSSALEQFATLFIMRGLDSPPNKECANWQRKLSTQYVIEELAETCYMISKGYNILVYPGSLAIFEKISEGCFKKLPVELNSLVNIGLRLKRKGKALSNQADRHPAPA